MKIPGVIIKMEDFKKDYSAFEAALDIEAPWYVLDYELDTKLKQLNIFLDFHKGARFTCSNCGHRHAKVHDVVNENRSWRHLDFWQFPTYLHARLPRTKCNQCGKVRTIEVDWSRKGSGFTWFFESRVMNLMKEMPVLAVAREVGEHDTRLWRVFHYYVQEAMDQLDLSSVKRIAIDETSSKRGHNYVTLFVDVDTKRVLFATEGKGADGLHTFKDFLETKGIKANQIKEVCSDMSPSFISGIETFFPEAHITFDKFHVMKLVNEALDKVRRLEQIDQPDLKRSRYLWLKNQDNLTESQQDRLLKLKDSDLKTGRAYRIKISLQRLWQQNLRYAPLYFEDWYNWAIRSQLEPMVNVAKSLKKHEKGILRWFTTKMTNGFLEGINGLIQASKRKARGFKSIKNYIAMIYATVNKLDILVKQPMTK